MKVEFLKFLGLRYNFRKEVAGFFKVNQGHYINEEMTSYARAYNEGGRRIDPRSAVNVQGNFARIFLVQDTSFRGKGDACQ